MSKSCKMVALLLALAMLLSCIGVCAEEVPAGTTEEVVSGSVTVAEATEAPKEDPTETPTEIPTEVPAEEPTETPAEEPAETPAETPTETPTEVPTETPAEEATAEPEADPTEEPEEEKEEITTGYALIAANALLYAEPTLNGATASSDEAASGDASTSDGETEIEDGNLLGYFGLSSYLYVYECVDPEWARVAVAYIEHEDVLIMKGYVRVELLTKVSNTQGAGPYIYNGIGLCTASFASYGASPDAYIDPKTKVAQAERVGKYVVENGQPVLSATGEVVSTKTYVVSIPGVALNYRSVSDGAVAGCLENGASVQVIEHGTYWSFVLINGKVYTMASAYLADPAELQVLPDNAKLMSAIQDALDKDRSVSIYIAYDGEYVNFGDTVALYAMLYGYEGTEYSIQWQISADNANWEDIDGACDSKYEVVVTEDNYTNFYRVAVTLTGVEVDDDLL